MEITLSELIKLVNGKVVGNDNQSLSLTGTCSIDGYMNNRISFARNMKFGEKASSLKNAVILIPQEIAALSGMYPQNTYVIVSDVDKAMLEIQDLFYANNTTPQTTCISPLARIADSAKLGNNVFVGDNAYIGENAVIGDGVQLLPNSFISDNVVIGKNTCIHPYVTCENCEIGDNTILRAGARIGVDGFRFLTDPSKKLISKMIHVGAVKIGNRVEIGANTAIQRSTFEGNPTTIGDDVKIACTIVIGHNTKVGARTIITCSTMIAGSNSIGEDVYVGAGAVISNGVTIGNRAKVLINAVVVNDVPDDGMVSGFYAMPHKQWKRVYKNMLSQI